MQNFNCTYSLNHSFFDFYPLVSTNPYPSLVFEEKRPNFQSQNTNANNKYEKLLSQYKKLQRQNEQLKVRLREIQEQKPQKIKRKYQRKNFSKNTQIIECPYPKCKKQYNSESALNYHIRHKHNGGTKLQRFEVAKKIILALKNHQDIPQQTVVLPPGYLQKIKQQKLQDLDSQLLCSQQSHYK